MVEIGRRIVNKDGRAAIYLGPGPVQANYSDNGMTTEETCIVYELTSGQQAVRLNADWTEDATLTQAQAVVVLNATPVKISTIFWGVVLAHLAIGVVVGLILILLH
jgi:hypothetical protein